jgi:hypothetical protein
MNSWLAQHIIYIPAALGVGFYLGWYFGTRTVRNEWTRAEKRRRQQEEAS